MGVTNFVDSTKKTPTFINDEITGIKVQYLKIILANLKENNELFVYSNDIEIAYNKKMISDDGDIQIELEIPNLKDSDKQSIENKYANLISSVKEDKMEKEDVLKLKDAAENYVNNVKESRGEKVEKKEEKK